MVTFQEYLNNKYPTQDDKEQVKEISIHYIDQERKRQFITENLEGGELDLSEYRNLEKISVDGGCLKTKLTKLELGNKPNLTTLDCYFNELTTLDLSHCFNLTKIYCSDNQLTSLNLSGCDNLVYFECSNNQLTSVDFLNQLHHYENLERLVIFNNNIQPTNIEFFSKFENLKFLKIGTTRNALRKNKRNKFYGSLESCQNLTKLEAICIEATDVNEGLEYLPGSLVQAIKKFGESSFLFSPCNTDAKCKVIQDQLRPYNYDLEAWQLAHPGKMLYIRLEYFTQEDGKEKWVKALTTKITQIRQELQENKTNSPEKTEKINYLEDKLINLRTIENLLEQRRILIGQVQEEREIHQDAMKAMDNFYRQNPPKKPFQDQATQTDLTGEEKIVDFEAQVQVSGKK